MHARFFFLLIALFFVATPRVAAQSELPNSVSRSLAIDSLTVADELWLPVPDFSMSAPGISPLNPFHTGLDASMWRLHEGFNAQLSLGISTTFGKGAFRGVGFGQSASFAYALPLGKRFSFAAGVYADNMDWGMFRQTEAGVAATVAFKVNDNINLYAYGSKSFFPRKTHWRNAPIPYFLRSPNSRIGAMAEFKFGKNASMQVSIERRD